MIYSGPWLLSLRVVERNIAMPKTTKLFIIGGAEKKGRDAQLLRFFFDLCGGPESHITIITCASQAPLKTGQKYEKIFSGFGSASVSILPVFSRKKPILSRPLSSSSNLLEYSFQEATRLRLRLPSEVPNWKLP